VVVGFEVRICASTEFVNIQALALAFGCHSLRDEFIEQPIRSIGHGKYKANERRDTDHLREPLILTIEGRLRKQTDRQNAPQTSQPVYGDCASWIIYFDVQLQPLNGEHDQGPGD